MTAAPVRALIVDDDPVYRRILDQSLRRVGVEQIAVAGELGVARRRIERGDIDVVAIDVVLRGESGLDLLRWMSAHHAKVITILLTGGDGGQASDAVDALLLGASAIVVKPTGPDAGAQLDRALGEIIRGLAAPRPTGRTGRLVPSRSAPIPRGGAPTATARDVIAIGASTGGPPAMLALLAALPSDFRTPIVITQHMPAPHVPMFATLLRERTGRHVAVAVHGEEVVAGRVYVAPGGRHLCVRRHGLRLVLAHDDGPEEHFCRPAVDPMFRSVAAACGPAAIGVVLTGMGSDGALGAQALHDRGAPVLIQDRASSVVWGMPGAVKARGAADVVGPVAELARCVATLDRSASAGDRRRGQERILP